MKIGLITHHWVPNFGANLQALSSYSYLKMNHNSIVLNYLPHELLERYRKICSEDQINEHINFTKEFMALSPLFETGEQLRDYCKHENIEVVVSGSDAIFRLSKELNTCEGGFPNPFWLDWAFTDPTYRPRTGFLSGSATGSAYYSFPKELKKGILEALAKVDYISVRDSWTKWMFAYLSHNRLSIDLGPDPAFMFNECVAIPEQYRIEQESLKGRYVLYSARPERTSRGWLVEFISRCHDNGWLVFGLPLPEYEMAFDGFDRNISLPLSPASWYSWIKNAAGFVGERFHPMVCSTLNEVPFVSIDHYRKEGIKGYFNFFNVPSSSKVYAQCKNAGLTEYCIYHRDFMHIKPGKVVRMLGSWPADVARNYNVNAQAHFRRNMDLLLGVRRDPE